MVKSFFIFGCFLLFQCLIFGDSLAGTALLEQKGDIASDMVSQTDQFLLEEIQNAIYSREQYWDRDTSSAKSYVSSLEKNRIELKHMLGVIDQEKQDVKLQYLQTSEFSAKLAKSENYDVHYVRWPVLDGVYAEGLLLEPKGGVAKANLIAIPDCENSPEELVGLKQGIALDSQFARLFAQNGYRVIVPTLLNRQWVSVGRNKAISRREWVQRQAYEMGKSMIGLEVQSLLALVNFFSQNYSEKIATVSWAEGGLLSLYCGAVDRRIDVTAVSGYFDRRDLNWQAPIDRNLFGLLQKFGDAELASLTAPRSLFVESCQTAELDLAGGFSSERRVVLFLK